MRPSYVTRKIALQPENMTQSRLFMDAMGDFRDLENRYSNELTLLMRAGLSVEKFRKKGETAPNALYSALSLHSL